MIKYLSKKLVKACAIIALAGLSGVVNAQTFNWSQAGPIYNAGRARNMIVDKNDPTGNTLYVGSASSGVFISTDGGVNWNALTLSGNKLNVSYLAQAVDGTIYVATGEGFLRPGQKLKAQPGTGLYKIVGAALTLVAPSSAVGTVINRVACSPSSPNNIAIATNFGIMVSTDGGSSFFVPTGIPSNSTTISGQDVKFDNSGILYCSAGNENSTSPAAANEFSKVYKSTDNTLTSFNALTTLNSPLVSGDNYGRIELAIAPTNNSVIYASCATKYAGTSSPASATLKGLFVSYDAGATWGLILQGSPQLDPLGNGGSLASGDYAQVVTVDPFSSDKIYLGSYQFYTWTRTGGLNSNPVGTWTKFGFNQIPNVQFYLAQNIHDIKLITSGNSIGRYFFITDAGIYRSSDALTSFQPFYKGLITGQFNSVSIERFPLAANGTSTVGGTLVTPYSGFIGGTGGNGLNYFSGNFPLVTTEEAYSSGDIYQSEFSKILPNAAYFTSGSGRLFRSTDVRSSDPTQIDLLINSKTQLIVPYNNTKYDVTGTPFKLWENYGQTTASPDSAVFYNDTLRFAASMIGVATLTTQTTFTFSAARPNEYALIDSIAIRTGTVQLPVSPGANSPAFTGSDKKDITIVFVDTYTAPATGTFTPPIKNQAGPVVTASTSVVLNGTTQLDNISVTFTAPPFLAKTTASFSGVPDAAAYYRVFATVFYKYKAGDVVTVVDDKISTKTYSYSTTLTQPLNWDYYGSLTSYTMGAAASSSAVSNPTYALAPGSYPNQTASSVFTVSPITTTNYTLSTYGGYTVTAKPVTYTISAVPAGTASISNPTYNLNPGNVTQTTTVFVVTPTTTTNYTITETGTGTLTSQDTYSTINSSTYNLMPGNVSQASPVFTIVVTPTTATTYTLAGLSSNTLIGVNTSTVATPVAVTSFSTFGYFAAPIGGNNKPVKIANTTSARLAMGYGANVYVSNAPLSLNNPMSMINVSSNKCLTTDNLGNKLSGASNTVAISGTVTALEWSKSGTELYYATNDVGTGNTYLYRVSYLDALMDSTSKSYSGKLHTNVFTFSTTVAEDGSKNNPRCPYRTTLLGQFTKLITGISVSNNNQAIAVTFDDVTGTKVMYSTVADVRKCDIGNINLQAKNGTGLNVSKVYCSLMEMSDNKKVFVGTDLGVYYTNDITAGSPTWVDINNNQMPVIQVFDIKQQVMKPWDCYNSGLIYAATNGRGIWINKSFSSPYYVSVNEIEANKAENNLSLYPNPTNGNVYVSFNGIDGETATINVMDINGRLIKTENLGKLNSGQLTYTFETADIANGMYIVSINSNSGTKRVAKLVVAK
ncbi:MAG: T9SS type A sorting domain-containing protein [Bacteroidota bacterium]|nr:T9SS type A sorting domain-containing protein [Bacteroidota bacterium]MDP3145301.1 T9SS type A sorting domain-containing protein [Bacteroidota bacterium]